MSETLFTRFSTNPILSPKDIGPSSSGLIVECLLNPGVFRFKGKTCMLLRVAERPEQNDEFMSFPVCDSEGRTFIKKIRKDDPELDMSDPRVILYRGENYLTTRSHLRMVFSDDGVNFYEDEAYPPIMGYDEYCSFGIEDCRVSKVDNLYCLTYSAISPMGVAIGLSVTEDWQRVDNKGIIFPPHNKDCAIFEEKISGRYYALHRPSSPEIGGNYMWLAASEDLIHWGEHKCIAMTRSGMFDSARLGAGAAPIATEEGWLLVYHGATEKNRYCLGAMLLDRNDPSKVLARSDEPIMEPETEYELKGFFGEVIFTNGHIVDGDKLTIYYGAADEVICGATASICEILKTLK